jgi:hypothetical protein
MRFEIHGSPGRTRPTFIRIIEDSITREEHRALASPLGYG